MGQDSVPLVNMNVQLNNEDIAGICGSSYGFIWIYMDLYGIYRFRCVLIPSHIPVLPVPLAPGFLCVEVLFQSLAVESYGRPS